MAYQNNNKNTTGQNNSGDMTKHVNTNSIQFYNSEGSDFQSTVALGWWNQKMEIKIHPALSQEARTETNKFDYNTSIKCSVSIEEGVILLDILTEALETTGDFCKGISIGGSGLLNIERNETAAMPSIYRDIQSDSMKCEDFNGFDFNIESAVISGYKPDGTAEITVTNHPGQFRAFISIVRSFIDTIGGCEAHAMRYYDRFYRSKVINGTGGASKGYTPGANVFNNSGSAGGSTYTPPSENSSLNGFI